MILDHSVKSRLVQHLVCLEVSQFDAKRFTNLISKWSRESGPVWTVARLKTLQQAHKDALINGTYPSIPEGWQHRRNSKNKWIFKDPLVHRMMRKTNSKRELELQLVFFRMHEVIKLSGATSGQFTKWVDGVVNPHTNEETVEIQIEKIGKFIDELVLPKAVPGWDKFTSLVHQPVRGKSSPSLTQKGVKSLKRTKIDVFTLEPLRHSVWYDIVQMYPSCVATCITGQGDQDELVKRVLRFGRSDSLTGGTIGFIQEKSAKLRAVASPFLVLQAMGEPAKCRMDNLSQIIPEMHTHSQDAAKQQVSDALALGQRVHGFDATAFTDRLPFKLQDLVLNKLVDEGWLSEFDQASINAMVKSEWAIPEDEQMLNVDTVKWSVGQPMGYGPSFHLAALTHYIILRYCADKAKVLWRNKFAVVGDDVTIFDDKIADEYYRTMTDLEVDINLEKSVTSNEVGEFCKKIILPDAVLKSITVQNNLVTGNAILQAAEFYGKRLLSVFPKKQLQMSDSVMLPIEMGGLNWSPKDSNYKEYVEEILNAPNIRTHLLQKSLIEFYDFDKSGNLEYLLTNVARRYDYWSYSKAYDISSNDRASLCAEKDVIVSEWTGLPAITTTIYKCASTTNKLFDKSTSPFTEIVDNSLRRKLSSQSINQLKFILVHFSWAFNKFGYEILNGEKTQPKRPISLWSIIKDDQDNKEPEKYAREDLRRYLKRRVTKYNW